MQVYGSGISLLESPNVRGYFAEQTDAEVRAANAGMQANAYTFAGTFSRRNPASGIWINQDAASKEDADWLVDLITHECAHFCGPLPPDEVKDQGDGDSALLLPREKAMKNAANCAWFAGLSQADRSQWEIGTYPSGSP